MMPRAPPLLHLDLDLQSHIRSIPDFPKPGKLPGEVVGLDYALEYGTDWLEIQANAFENSPSVLVVDDLLATGGTAAATGKLVEQAGGCLVGFAFVIELEGLGGRQALPAGHPVEALLRYG